jgi:cell division protein FtsX
MITKLLFLLSESIRALFRAKLPATISSITIAIALVIFSIAYFTYVNLLGYSYKFKSKYRIEVFFESDLEANKYFNPIF